MLIEKKERSASIISLKYIAEISVLIYSFLVFDGAFTLNIYYSKFNIQIFNYLSLTEILVSFFDKISFIVCFFAGFFAFILGAKKIDLLFTFIKSNFRKYKIYQFLSKKLEFLNEKSESKVGIDSAMIIAYIAVAIFVIYAYFFYEISKGIPISMLFILLFAIAFIIVSFAISVDSLVAGNFIHINITSILCFIFISVLITVVNVDSTYETAKIEKCKIYFNSGDSLSTNSNNMFVGQTNNFVFLYSPKDQSRQVIHISEIKRIVFEKIKK